MRITCAFTGEIHAEPHESNVEPRSWHAPDKETQEVTTRRLAQATGTES
jgi:hypothetical protein